MNDADTSSIASPQQQRLFFALCREAGIDAEEGKERAKAKFQLEHFTEISKTQLTFLIDGLQKKIQTTTKKALQACLWTFSFNAFKQGDCGEGYDEYPVFLVDKLMQYFDIREKQGGA